MTSILRVAVVSAVSLMLVRPLAAQSREKPDTRASFAAGASFGDGGTALALSAGLRFGFSTRFGLEVEAAYARKLDFTIDLCPAPRICVLGGQLPVTGRTVSLVPHLALELLPPSGAIRAYVVAGVGAGHVRQRYFSSVSAGSGAERVEFTRSSLTLALSFGGGATVQVSRRLAIGADVRSLHLLDEAANLERFITPSGALSTLRVGSRVSWQF
jgi:opacity protein-like surface antigen